MERRKKASRSPEASVQLSTAPSLLSVGREATVGEEIAALNASLKESGEKLAHVREKNREMTAALQMKRLKITELDGLHEQKQGKILQYERQLATKQRFPYIHDMKIRKSELIAAESSQFAAIKALIQNYIEEIERMDSEFPLISHDVRLVEIMNTQISLYRSQIQQQETNFLRLLARFSRAEEELEAEISDLRALKDSRAGSLQENSVQREGNGEGRRKSAEN